MDDADDYSITTEDFIDAQRLMVAERVRQYYIRNRERILESRHVAYFKKKKLKKIPERTKYEKTKYLTIKEEDGTNQDSD